MVTVTPALIFTSLECGDGEHGSCSGSCAGCGADCLCACHRLRREERERPLHEGWQGEPAPETAWFA